MLIADIERSCLDACDLPIEEIPFIDTCSYSELFLGSYCCGNYFCYLLSNLYKLAFNTDSVAIRLVIPPLSEKQYSLAGGILSNCDLKVFSAVSVNDIGAINICRSLFSHCRINIGRIMFRQYRDYRYPEIIDRKVLVDSYPLCELIDSSFMHIFGLEIDCIGTELSLEDVTDYAVYVHSPLVLMSYGHICEFASIGVDITQKFRPDMPCAFQCFQQTIQYDCHEVDFAKIGRAVYHKPNKDIKITNGSIIVIKSALEARYEDTRTAKQT